VNAKRVTEFRVGDLYSKHMECRRKWLMVVRVMAAQEIVGVLIYDSYHHGAPRHQVYDMKQLGRALKNFERSDRREMPAVFCTWANNFCANGHRRPPVIDTAEKAIAALRRDAEVLGDAEVGP
jgi:hypothetical protein